MLVDPKFVKRVRLSFNFERVQRIRLLVVDVDKGVDPMRPGSEQQCVSAGRHMLPAARLPLCATALLGL